MPQYEIDPARMKDATRKKVARAPLERVLDPESGRLLVRSEKKLPRAEGVREIEEGEFEKVLAAVRETGRHPGHRAVRGGMRLEASRRWKVAPESPRGARLHWLAVTGDAQALGVELGAGRGDRVEIVRPIAAGSVRGGVSLQVRPTLEAGAALRVAVVLTSDTERPWLERGPEPAEPGAWTPLEFDFSDVDERRLGRADRLVIVLHTDADEGACMVRDVLLLG